jgi:hypothetical protein
VSRLSGRRGTCPTASRSDTEVEQLVADQEAYQRDWEEYVARRRRELNLE